MQLPVTRAWGSAVGLDQNIYLLGGNSEAREPASNQCLVWMPSRPQESGDCWYAVSRTPPDNRLLFACMGRLVADVEQQSLSRAWMSQACMQRHALPLVLDILYVRQHLHQAASDSSTRPQHAIDPAQPHKTEQPCDQRQPQHQHQRQHSSNRVDWPCVG